MVILTQVISLFSGVKEFRVRKSRNYEQWDAMLEGQLAKPFTIKGSEYFEVDKQAIPNPTRYLEFKAVSHYGDSAALSFMGFYC